MSYEEKKQHLKTTLQTLAQQNVVVAFSGGVDSSLLLHLCCAEARKTGTKVYAITMLTELHPHGDLDIARRVALETGALHEVIRINELTDAGIRMNPVDRCYRCKRTLFSMLVARARELGAAYVVEGTNEDDLHVYRPGIKALGELGILSPLAQCGLTKEEVRQLASEFGLSVARRPSTPCMATRFPYDTELSYEAMKQVDEAETYLRAQGFYNVRLRVHGEVARLEIDTADMPRLLSLREEIIRELHQKGFTYITLDLEGFRSGSMDINLNKR